MCEAVTVTSERGFRKKVPGHEVVLEKATPTVESKKRPKKRLRAVEQRTESNQVPHKIARKPAIEKTVSKAAVENLPALNDSSSHKKYKGEDQKYILFLGNLPYRVKEDDVRNHFGDVGEIVRIRLPREKGTERPKGFGFLEVADAAAYEKAVGLHHSYLLNRRINVEWTFPGGSGSEKRRQLIHQKSRKLHQLSKKGKIQRLQAKKKNAGDE